MAASSLLCCTALSIMGLGLRLQTSERADEGGVTALLLPAILIVLVWSGYIRFIRKRVQNKQLF